MLDEAPKSNYLDEIFASVRAFSRDLASSREWLARAKRTSSQSWKLSFWQKARVAHTRAEERLAEASGKLQALGAGQAPPPLDQLQGNLATMRADVDSQGEALSALGRDAAKDSQPLGRA